MRWVSLFVQKSNLLLRHGSHLEKQTFCTRPVSLINSENILFEYLETV